MAIKVTFRPVVAEGDSPAVALSPTDQGWNDFGFNFHAFARFYDPGGRDPILMQSFVIPFGDDGSPVRNFQRWYDSRADNLHIRRGETAGRFNATVFNFMFATESSYARLLEWCGSELEYQSILESLNDITWLMRQEDTGRDIARATISTAAFRLGVIRTGAAYRAFRRGFAAASHGNQQVSEARAPFSYSAQLAGFQGPHSIDIYYKDHALVSDRVHCIIGMNGVGKSRFLASFVDYLASKSESDSLVLLSEAAVANEVPAFSRILVYTTERGSPLPESFSVDSSFDYQHVSLTSPIGDDGVNIHQSTSLARMLVDLLRERDITAEDMELDRHRLFLKAAARHINLEYACIPLRGPVADSTVFRDMDGHYWARYSDLHRIGEQRGLEITGELQTEREMEFFDHAGSKITISSGQRVFLRFALHFLTFSTKGMLVVLDEPETHLHPNLVSSFSLLLNEVLQATLSVALVATHSVYLAREVPTHCNHILKVSDDIPEFGLVYLKTLGASPTSISLAVFGDDSAKAYHKRAAALIAQSGMSLDEVIAAYREVMSSDMLMQVRDLIAHGPAD
jgi:hypothetical protein